MRIFTLGLEVRNNAKVAVIRGRAESAVIRLTLGAGSLLTNTVPGFSSPITGESDGSKLVGSLARPLITVRRRWPVVSRAIVVHEMVLPSAKPRMRPWPLLPFIGRRMFGETRAVAFQEPPRLSNADGTDSGAMP